MYKVIAISGSSGSGKTTVSEEILKRAKKLVYFDFGFLFRPITYYLVNELNMDEDSIKNMVLSGQLQRFIKVTYKVINNKVEVGVNGKFYSFGVLNTPKMNMDTITVGTIIGDTLNDALRSIVDDLKKENNVLLNARRPIVAYPKADCHIFLEASFDERIKRKMLMNNEDYETTLKKLKKRDEKEETSGFWEKYDFTKIIDTTNLTKEEAVDKVLQVIKNEFVSFNNLTLILGSYKCNKNCPYCIAKNNKKFSADDNLDYLDEVFNELLKYKIKFKRFVVSGNGEPSFYSLENLKIIRDLLIKYQELFEIVRVHSSGNIFSEEKKFKLFNLSNLPLEFEVLRVALNPYIDMNILGYDEDYLKTNSFHEGNIKCDIALTDYLEADELKFKLYNFLEDNPSIKKVRLKSLLAGDSTNTKQAQWVRKHSLSADKIQMIIEELGLNLNDGIYSSDDGKIIYKTNGDYTFDYVINDGIFQNYNNEKCSMKVLRRKLGG